MTGKPGVFKLHSCVQRKFTDGWRNVQCGTMQDYFADGVTFVVPFQDCSKDDHWYRTRAEALRISNNRKEVDTSGQVERHCD